MKPFSKTYYTDKLNITIRIKRDCLDSTGCRLTIKLKTEYGGFIRIVYDWFSNDKNMFRTYQKKMIKVKVPIKTIDDIIEDIKKNLFFEKIITYKQINNKLWKVHQEW